MALLVRLTAKRFTMLKNFFKKYIVHCYKATLLCKIHKKIHFLLLLSNLYEMT